MTRAGSSGSTDTSPGMSRRVNCRAGSSWSPAAAESRTCLRCGHADVEAGRPVEVDTLWRIYSMTKPVTSVAAMMLFEEGAFDLTDPIARWLPEFAQPRVYVKGSATQSAHRAGDRTDPSCGTCSPIPRA